MDIISNKKEIIKILQENPSFFTVFKEDGKKYTNQNSINFFKWYKDDDEKITINIKKDHLIIHRYN